MPKRSLMNDDEPEMEEGKNYKRGKAKPSAHRLDAGKGGY